MKRKPKNKPCRIVEIRQHRDTLEESLATSTTIEASIQSLCKYINWTFNEAGVFMAPVTPDRIHIIPKGYDIRCGWDAELIKIDGIGLWGVANGYIPTEAELMEHFLA